MQPTALLIALGLFLAGVGFVVVSFARLPGILMLLAGVAIIGVTLWLRANS
jgi:hypothetical protein